jgi:hypothetical protein
VEADAATAYLIDNIISDLLKSQELENTKLDQLKDILHKWGVNLRFCAVIYHNALSENVKTNIAIQVTVTGNF